MYCMMVLMSCFVRSIYCYENESYEVYLPPEHMPYYFTSNPIAAEACRKNMKCPYKDSLVEKQCWGYEPNCTNSFTYSKPICDGSSKGWSNSKAEQIQTFFSQGDFGYVRDRKLELQVLCEPQNKDDSFLECAKYMRFCRARNIMFDFKALATISEPMRYREDVISEGQVGGHCELKKEVLKQQGQHKSPLQSWFAELEHFTELPHRPIVDGVCDVVINKPTFIMKLDATVNMYHHFCDFLNLYATLHLNNTFLLDVYILIWDTTPYHSNFAQTWQAFTKHPLMNLNRFKGKKVCFTDAVFPLLPRMIFGMYYNMPLVPGCVGSSLFQAFSKHIEYRLKVNVHSPEDKIRVTLISRSTQYRKILNEDELVAALSSHPGYQVRKVNFNRQLQFSQQLEVSYNTDILIGIHGAGLTQMLFMPSWGSVFEIYNCDDENCYADLARLKGLHYVTWRENRKLFPQDEGHHPTLGAHAKFTNYAFDVDEFLRILQECADHVRNHLRYPQRAKQCEERNCNLSKQHIEL